DLVFFPIRQPSDTEELVKHVKFIVTGQVLPAPPPQAGMDDAELLSQFRLRARARNRGILRAVIASFCVGFLAGIILVWVSHLGASIDAFLWLPFVLIEQSGADVLAERVRL